MDLKNIGKNIKNLRIQKGLTQAQLAEKACLSNVHMSHIETGSVAMSIDSLITISNALNTTPNNILLGEYNIPSSEASALVGQYLYELTTDENRLIIEIARLLENMKINRK